MSTTTEHYDLCRYIFIKLSYWTLLLCNRSYMTLSVAVCTAVPLCWHYHKRVAPSVPHRNRAGCSTPATSAVIMYHLESEHNKSVKHDEKSMHFVKLVRTSTINRCSHCFGSCQDNDYLMKYLCLVLLTKCFMCRAWSVFHNWLYIRVISHNNKWR